MRNISTAIYVYFILRIKHENNKDIKIIFYPAKYKLKCCDIKIENKYKSKYAQNKHAAIEHTRYLITKHLPFFEKCNKKDDLADCFLQALSYKMYFLK